MKIEKVNENQIRCTLTKEDLASRELKISELAYGTEKAKTLFRDMMQQANFEFGFEADDIPLMIEAIPMNAECIVLIITKVEDPEELDTRFSRFAPSVHEDEDGESMDTDAAREEVLDLFKRIQSEDTVSDTAVSLSAGTASGKEPPKLLLRLFQFDSLRQVLQLAGQFTGHIAGRNSLYKDPKSGEYLLLVSYQGEHPELFNKLCNVASEYGRLRKTIPSTPSYLEEHCTVLISSIALQVLSGIAG